MTKLFSKKTNRLKATFNQATSASGFVTTPLYTTNKKQKRISTSTELTYPHLVFLWAMVLFGYFLFVIQWYSISNFQMLSFGSGWGAAFFKPGVLQPPFITGVPNWMITLGRSIGSFLAGWLIVKIGHKYAVIAVMALMVCAFPFIILGQNQSWNSASIAGGSGDPDGIAAGGFAGFVLFRILLGIGGTCLITYTNSIIGSMPANKKPLHLTANTIGFNGGAFLANIFFVIPIYEGINNIAVNQAIWTGVVSGFVILVFVLLIGYLVFAKEVVPKKPNNKIKNLRDAPNAVTFKTVLKDKEVWRIAGVYTSWVIAAIFMTSGTIRAFIEQSPANFRVIAIQDALYGVAGVDSLESISETSYYWVWPLFVSLFVVGLFAGMYFIPVINNTIFHRNNFIAFCFSAGSIFALIALMLGHFAGFDNHAALVLMFIFIFFSGMFLWGVQSIILTVPQQLKKSSPAFIGIAAGIIWGVGYFGYTINEAVLSLIVSYADPLKTSVGGFGASVSTIGNTLRFAAQNNGGLNYDNVASLYDQGNLLITNPDGGILLDASNNPVTGTISSIAKNNETIGTIVMIVLFTLALLTTTILSFFLPKSGYHDVNGQFCEFTKNWSPFSLKNWNFRNPDVVIPQVSK